METVPVEHALCLFPLSVHREQNRIPERTVVPQGNKRKVVPIQPQPLLQRQIQALIQLRELIEDPVAFGMQRKRAFQTLARPHGIAEMIEVPERKVAVCRGEILRKDGLFPRRASLRIPLQRIINAAE